MAKTVNDAFRVLEGWLTPSTTETRAAASHRSSIEQCLKSTFGMTNFFRSGSFGYGTSVSGFSDVDYFAVIQGAQLDQNSNTSLQKIERVLAQRFPSTGVHVDAPAVVVPFGTTKSERHEVIPAHKLDRSLAWSVYGIPNRAGGWMASSPDAYGALIDGQQKKLGRVKALIRFIKAWKYYNNVPIRSFYIEMAVWAYATTQSTIVDKIDVIAMLRRFDNTQLSNLTDPYDKSEAIYAGFTAQLPIARAAVKTALSWADWAYAEENAGRMQSAFTGWDKVFAGKFPAYY
jgi:hypothetical protein